MFRARLPQLNLRVEKVRPWFIFLPALLLVTVVVDPLWFSGLRGMNRSQAWRPSPFRQRPAESFCVWPRRLPGLSEYSTRPAGSYQAGSSSAAGDSSLLSGVATAHRDPSVSWPSRILLQSAGLEMKQRLADLPSAFCPAFIKTRCLRFILLPIFLHFNF